MKPRDGAIWSSFSTDIHGFHAKSPEIKNAKRILIVWNEFVSYIDKNIGKDQRGCAFAWNIESCDIKWICKLMRAPGSKLAMPKGIRYFMDHLYVIRKFKSWKLHPNTSKLERLPLPSV